MAVVPSLEGAILEYLKKSKRIGVNPSERKKTVSSLLQDDCGTNNFLVKIKIDRQA